MYVSVLMNHYIAMSISYQEAFLISITLMFVDTAKRISQAS